MSTPLRAFAASFLINLLVLIAMLVFAAPWLEPSIALVSTAVIGLAAGAVMGGQVRNYLPFPLALGALCAAVVLSLPVILASYGLALMGLPLLPMYAGCVGAGAHLARKPA